MSPCSGTSSRGRRRSRRAVDAVLLELVDQVGQDARPGRARRGRASATPGGRCAGRRCRAGQEAGSRAEADPRPDIGEGEHRREASLARTCRRRLQCINCLVRDGSPHSCRKCPPSAISSGGGQFRMWACKARITGGPSTGSFMPIAIRLLPVQALRQKSRAWREIAAPSASGPVGHQVGKARARPPCRRRRGRARHRRSASLVAEMRAGALHQAARCPCRGCGWRSRASRGSPGQGLVAGAQRGVHHQQRLNRPGMAIGRVRPIRPPQSCTTSTMLRRSSASMRSISAAAVEIEGVGRFVGRLVGAAEAQRSRAPSTRWPAAAKTGIMRR